MQFVFPLFIGLTLYFTLLFEGLCYLQAATYREIYFNHKFTFYAGNPDEYNNLLAGRQITKINDRNFYIEIEIEDYLLLMRDGAAIRYSPPDTPLPKKSKLLLQFDDNSYLSVTVLMYAFIGVISKSAPLEND